jgi:hypothetical protein
MAIDFGSKESRDDYLNNKLDDLLSNVNETYGQVLLEELVTRLERTLADFNEEFEGIVGDLKVSSDRRNQILHDLMIGKDSEIADQSKSLSDVSETPEISAPEMSEWEKRLESKK